MQKIVLIVPYFGRFDSYFPLWLQSCRYNPTIDWILFTDDKTAYDYPPNVKVHYTNFEELRKTVQQQYEFEIELNYPYQICDFRVIYGEVFASYIREYDFWGYCDVDLIWGNLREHITEPVLSEYDKISWRGHLTLFRNTPEINGLYRNPLDGVLLYQYVLANKADHPLYFEEREINVIFEAAGKKIYKEMIFADLRIRSFPFVLLHFPEVSEFVNQDQVFLWEKGNLYRLFCSHGKVYQESFAYIHFLKRSMKAGSVDMTKDSFLIVPNKFLDYPGTIDHQAIMAFSKDRFYASYFFSKINLAYIRSKIKYFRGKKIFEKIYGFLPVKRVTVILPLPRDTREFVKQAGGLPV